MGVLRTDQWLQTENHPYNICNKLIRYFNNVKAEDIFTYLTSHGMYRHPLKNKKEFLNTMQKKQLWELVQQEMKELQKLWNGPNIPVFIFPADQDQPILMNEYGGKSGLAFKDKLFLFLSDSNSDNEIKALFTHEYNHVCRLHKYKKESDYTLLDTIILEGLAENAVNIRHGEKYVANWKSYYSDDELKTFWKKFILPNKDIPKSYRQHHDLLYGIRFYPKMLGYCVGYYMTNQYLKRKPTTIQEMLAKPSEVIAEL